MGIKWYSEAEAETEFDTTLDDWAKNQGYKGCYSADETRRFVWKGLWWARKSETAKQLMLYVTNHPKNVIVVGMRGGFQCFNSTEGVKNDKPVVYIDVDGKLDTIVRGPHNLHMDPEKCIRTEDKRAGINNYIAMLHEFGHAKQWMERPMLFDNQARKPRLKPVQSSNAPLSVREKALKLGGAETDMRLGRARAGFASELREKATEHWTKKGGDISLADLRSQVELDDFESAIKAGPQWARVVEMDNMSRHEWPICGELDLPLRTNYRDINATSDGQPSVTSQIRRKAEELGKAMKERADNQAAELKKMTQSGGTFRCKCGETFPGKLKLTQHCALKKHKPAL
jgi:hypothetical protein